MRRNQPDLDTETGLPRKSVSKWAVWTTQALLALVLWIVLGMREDIKKQGNDITELKVIAAQMRGMMKMAAHHSPPAIATTHREPVPIP